ncbi:MAG: DNA polymerase IV, partial [Candidatus Syntrophosphaera sp.]|nr:DNA polymerase IV [Candidatus Syntrophosphaera sp.]
NFEVITRSCPLPEPTADRAILYEYAEKLFLSNWDHYRKIRLLGVGVGKLESEKSEKAEQLEILI